VFDNNLNALKLYETEEGIEFTKNKIKLIDPTSDTGYRALTIESSNAVVSGSGGNITITAGNSGFLDFIPSGGGALSLIEKDHTQRNGQMKILPPLPKL
jgi:hypothetical protein